MGEPLSVTVLPGKRPRKHEATLTVYAGVPGLIPIGEMIRSSSAEANVRVHTEMLARQQTARKVLAQGACVTHSYCDPDHSGGNRHLLRPGMEQSLVDLEARTIRGMAVVDIDRLTRLSSVLERFCAIYEANEDAWRKGKEDQLFWYCTDGEVDLRTEAGRDEARTRVMVAKREREQGAKRQRRRHAVLREMGTLVGPRAFGHTTAGELIPEEADAIRLLADAVDMGQKVAPVVRALADKGFVGRDGRPFTHRRVQVILTSARIVGLRVDGTTDDGIARDDQDEPIRGNQPAIIKMDQWLRIKARYAEASHSEAKRKYLGSGSFICTCGTVMGAGWKKSRNTYRYSCLGRGDSCGSNSLHGPWADAAIELLVELALEQDAPEVAEPEPWPEADQLARIETRRSDAKARRDAGELDAETWLDQDLALAEVVGGLRRSQRAWLKAHPLAPAGPANRALRERWRSGNEDQRRSVVRDLFRGFIVAPAVPGASVSERLTPVPR
jgi:site-specific DNA recombinase